MKDFPGCNSPRPGPLHWNWRCLNCGKAISIHPPLWRRLLTRLNRHLAAITEWPTEPEDNGS